jgi:6-phosphogluconolactonase (cycloisomerase 2 family)
VTFSPNGQAVFVALGTAGDLAFPFQTSSGTWGGAAALSTGSANSADNTLTVSANGSYLYVARTNSASNGFVAVYTITYTSSGVTVSPSVGPQNFSAGVQPFSVVLNTLGTNLYVANQASQTGGNSISGYSGAATGALAALSSSPYSITAPTALAVDRSGTCLLAISSSAGGNNLTMFSFDSSGNLVSSTSANAGSGPVALATTH